MSYYDETKAKWECEDKSLVTTKDGLLCGETKHLTNFALLLTGGPDQSSPDSTISWVSLGLVAGAIVIVALSSIVVEIRIRHYRRRQEALLKLLASNQLQCM